MSYRDLVTIDHTIELDTSNLDDRLNSMQEAIDALEGMPESAITDLITNEIDNRDLLSSSDVDADDLERRISDLENNAQDNSGDLTERLETLEARISALAETSERAMQVFNALTVVVGILTEQDRRS